MHYWKFLAFWGTFGTPFAGWQESNAISQILLRRNIMSYSLNGSIENIGAGLINNTESAFYSANKGVIL